MAITWRGSVVTPQIEAQVPSVGSVYVFAIVNTFRSRSKINILRMVVQMDNIQPPTGTTANRIMPIMRARRCSASDVSGGFRIAARSAFDTNTNNPDPGILVLFSPGTFGNPDGSISVASTSSQIWQQYTMRQATAVEQQVSWDNFALPSIAVSKSFCINPGEAVVVQQVAALPTGGVSFCMVAWEEDQVDTGFAVSGTVTLDSSPVSGATVFIMTDSTVDMTNPELSVLSTNASGQYTKQVATGTKVAAFVQYKDGTDLYTDEGKPFVEGP
jgi:hypothetical protein